MKIKRIADNIRKSRKIYGETQEQLAKYLGYSKTTISNYEKGIRQLSLDDLEKISEHYFTTIDDLLKSETPDYVIECIDYPFFYQQIGIMFPALGHTEIMEKGNDESFIEAVTIHRSFLKLISDIYNINENDDDVNPEGNDIDLNLCRENYLRAVQKEKYTYYCKANMVGLYLVIAFITYSIRFTSEAPVSFFVKMFDDPAVENIIAEGWSKRKDEWEPIYERMRDKKSLNLLDKYISDLTQNDSFKEFADYYKCWRFILNLVDNDKDRITNANYGIMRMIEYAETGNTQASLCVKILECSVFISK